MAKKTAYLEYGYRDFQGKQRLVVTRGRVIFHDAERHIYVTQVRKKPQRFDVHYGLQRWDNRTYEDACLKLGASIMHSMACAGDIEGD